MKVERRGVTKSTEVQWFLSDCTVKIPLLPEIFGLLCRQMSAHTQADTDKNIVDPLLSVSGNERKKKLQIKKKRENFNVP